MGRAYRFDRAEVRPVERQLLIDGRAVALGARAFDVLLLLIERRERLVGKQELLERAWHGLVVEEGNLAVQVSALRKLLGPGAIATIPGRGYRFAAQLEGEDSVAGAPSERARGNLPERADLLIGRDADILDVASLVAGHRLVTIWGPAGIGKTCVAEEAARASVAHFAHGVAWVDLASVRAAEKLAPAIAIAAGVRLGEGDVLAQLAQALAGREVLLVLDNCEHLAAAVACAAQRILDKAARVRILATSRESLHVPCEYRYRLEPLAVPAPGTHLNKARTFSAVQLLELRAAAADRRFALTEQNSAAAIELCRRLDGLPLAIQMAAARLPTLGIEEVHARLGEHLAQQPPAGLDADARHASLRAAFDWSHSLLDAGEQAVLRRLSVFAGSFRLDAALHVARDPGEEEGRELDALVALVDASLVQVDAGEPPRYRLLESTRLHAREKLGQQGEWAAAMRRHGEAMAHLADRIQEAFWELPEEDWLLRHAPDYEDLHEAFAHAAARDDAETAAATASVLWCIDVERDMETYTRQRKQAALALIPFAGARAEALLWGVITSLHEVTIPGVSQLEAARRRVEATRKLDDPKGLAMALMRLAKDSAAAGIFDVADAALREARALECPDWPPRLRWLLAFYAAGTALSRGDASSARESARDMRRFGQRLGARCGQALPGYYEGLAALREGDWRLAVEILDGIVGVLRELALSRYLAFAMSHLCAAHLGLGDLASARRWGAQALPLILETSAACRLFDPLARLAAREGRFREAAMLLGFADGTRGHSAAPGLDEAVIATESALGSEEHRRLRSAGARLHGAEAEALARSALEARTEVPA